MYVHIMYLIQMYNNLSISALIGVQVVSVWFLFFTLQTMVQRTPLNKYPHILLLVFLKAPSLEVVLFGQHTHAF